MRILLTGVTGLRNRGVEALVVPTVAALLEDFPDSEIHIATWSPDYDAARIADRRVRFFAQPPVPIPGSGPKRPAWRVLLSHWKARLRGMPPPSPSPFGRPDLVISTGGDIFSSDYGIGSLRFHLGPLEWAASAGVPSVALAQSIGPFRTAEETALWSRIAAGLTLITVRESLTRDYLVQDLKLDAQRVRLTADPAFLLPPAANVPLLGNDAQTSPLVAISISQGIARWTGVDATRHLTLWTTLIRFILEQWHARVVIIPHVQEGNGDDRIIGTRVVRALNFDPRVQLAAGDFSAAEFKALIARCDMVIAERMHAAIAGLSSGVCTVAVGYSVKARGIVESLLGVDATALGCVIPLAEFMEFERTAPKLGQLWRDREKVRQRLLSALPRAIDGASRNFDLIRECFAAVNATSPNSS